MSKHFSARIALVAASLTLVVGGAAASPVFARGHDASSPRDYDAEILAAQQQAKTAAGLEHLGTLNRLCFLPPVNGAPDDTDVTPPYIDDPSQAPAKSTWYADSAQVFDDLYFVGGSIHSAWLLDTGSGLILIDSGYEYSAKTLILDGMKRFGFDPTDIKYIVISHAHADHIGGVQVVQQATDHAPVVIGAADYQTVLTHPKTFKGQTPEPGNVITVSKARNLRLGDKTLHIIPTPGHTPGTLSFTFTVHDHGTPYNVAYVGGTAFGFQNSTPDPGIANYQTYIDSVNKLRARADKVDATVLLSNHSEFDNAAVKTRLLATRGFGPNPFVNGRQSVDNYFTVTKECAVAAQLQLEKVAAGQ